MADRTGAIYERLTSQLMLELEQVHAVNTIEITSRKIVQGRTTRHEIDLWWVFNWMGRRFTVAFQCKDWVRPVEQGELLKFQAVLADLATYDPSGVFVTRTGYQSGSRAVAGGNRISLLELREPGEQDWAGRIQTVEIVLQVVVPVWRDFQLQLAPGAEDLGVESLAGCNQDLAVHEPGKPSQTVLEIQKQLSPVGFEAADWQRLSVEFGPGAWLGSDEDSGLRVPVAGLSAEVRQDVHELRTSLSGSNVVTHVLKNVLTGTTVAFGPDGKPRQGEAGLAALNLRPHNRGDPPEVAASRDES